MGYIGGVMGMGTARYMGVSGAPVLIQVATGGISSGATHRVLTFYGTGLAYERVTAPKLPNTYIRDRLAAVEEMNQSEGCDEGGSGPNRIPDNN